MSPACGEPGAASGSSAACGNLFGHGTSPRPAPCCAPGTQGPVLQLWGQGAGVCAVLHLTRLPEAQGRAPRYQYCSVVLLAYLLCLNTAKGHWEPVTAGARALLCVVVLALIRLRFPAVTLVLVTGK